MARFQTATRVAAGALNDGALPLGVWAMVVRRCDLILRGTDPAMRQASALAPLLATGAVGEGARMVTAMGLSQSIDEPLAKTERQELRLVAIYVTRAASREADPANRLLLAGIERSLLGSLPPTGSFEDALRRWSQAVAGSSAAMSPEEALAVARVQRSLLTSAVELMNGLEVADGVGHERLLAAMVDSRNDWSDAHDAWLRMLPRQTEVGRLDAVATELQRAARGPGGVDVIHSLLITGFGGNLAAALAVTPADMRVESGLVAAAVTLEQRSDLAAVVQPRRVSEPEPPVRAPVVSRVGPAVQFTADTSPTQQVAEPRSASPDPERPRIEDHAALVELAGQRDAGVIAAAARSGVAEAQALTAGASPGELDALVERGRLARAAIAASGVAAAKHWSKKIPPALAHARDEYVAEASLRMAEIVDRWDPRRASWGSFAYREAGYEFWDHNRRRLQSREVVSERIGDFASGQDRTVGPVSESPEELVLLREERERVAQLVEGLPGRLSEVMAGRLGLAGQRKTLAAVGEETGSSVSTTHRDEREGTRLLAVRYLAGQEDQSLPTPVAQGPVTLRLLAQVLQSGEGTVGESVAVRPEHRGGRPAPGVRGVSR